MFSSAFGRYFDGRSSYRRSGSIKRYAHILHVTTPMAKPVTLKARHKQSLNGTCSRSIGKNLSIVLAVAFGAFSLLSRPDAIESSTQHNHDTMRMPSIGLGTFGISPAQITGGGAIKNALAAGYRLIDCAPVYFNEKEIGDALAEELGRSDTTLKRADIFVTSKLASPFHRKEHVEPALHKTLQDLRLDYLDIYLIHWPVAFNYVPIPEDGSRGWPNEDIDDSGGGNNIDPSVSARETWSAMEELVDKGLVKHIGVSNFPVALLHELLADCRIPPLVNQVELHPYLQQPRLVEYCKARGVHVQAYSPLGTPGYKEDGEPSVLNDPILSEMAKEKGCTVSQLCIAWALKRGTYLNAKSAFAEHQQENIVVLNNPIELDDADMARIASLERRFRYFRPDDWWGPIGAVFD